MYWTRIWNWIWNQFHFQSGLDFDSLLIFIQALIPHSIHHYHQLFTRISNEPQKQKHTTDTCPTDQPHAEPNHPEQAEDAQEEKPMRFFCFRSSWLIIFSAASSRATRGSLSFSCAAIALRTAVITTCLIWPPWESSG